MSTTLTECPKCGTHTGRIAQFRHVEGGICFLCNGAGRVTEAAASRWLASQLRAHGARPVQGATNRPSRPTKTVEIDGLGTTRIVKHETHFTASFESAGPLGGRMVFFSICGGRVVVDTEAVQNGIRHGVGVAYVEKHLQAALKR